MLNQDLIKINVFFGAETGSEGAAKNVITVSKTVLNRLFFSRFALRIYEAILTSNEIIEKLFLSLKLSSKDFRESFLFSIINTPFEAVRLTHSALNIFEPTH